MSFFKSNYEDTNLPETDEVRDTIAQRLKELRQRFKYMQKDVADLAGINVFTYSGYENARALPPVDCLIRIAEIYKVSLDYIVGRVDTVRTMVGESFDPNDDNIETRLARVEKALRENNIDY